MTQEAIVEVVAPVVEAPVVEPKADRGDSFALPPEVAVTTEPEVVVEPPVIPPDPLKDPEAKVDEKKDEERPRGPDGKFLPEAPVKATLTIPKARFDEVNTKARTRIAALEGQIKDLEGRLSKDATADSAALATEIETKTDEYGKFLADGELDKARDVMKEILAANRRISAIESAELANAHGREANNVQTITELVDLYKANYPVFDDAHADYSQEQVDFVAGLQDRFERTGSSPAEALREAVELAVAKFGLDSEPAAAPAAKGKIEAERKAGAVKAATDAANRQAPELKTGLDSDKSGLTTAKPSSMSYDAFSKLTADEKSKLRGDIVT